MAGLFSPLTWMMCKGPGLVNDEYRHLLSRKSRQIPVHSPLTATHTGKQLFKIKPIYSHVRQVKMFYKKKKETKIKIYTYNIQGVSYIYSIS